MRIEVHSRDGCPFCESAVEWLEERGIRFEQIKHNNFDERQLFYDSLELTGSKRSVPQILVITDDGIDRVGGYTELVVSDLHDRYLAVHGVELDHDF